jgi:hypothetical protein
MVTLLTKVLIASVVLTGSGAPEHAGVTASAVACTSYSHVLHQLRVNQNLLTEAAVKVIQESYLTAQPICHASVNGMKPVGEAAAVYKAIDSAVAVLCSMKPDHDMCPK